MTASRQALVVRGGWPGHQPVETTELFIPFLERSGFGVRIEDGPGVYADAAAMAAVDLIVQVNTMATIERAEMAGLDAAVRAGTGFAGWHGGIVDAYRATPDYLQLTGGQFVAHPGRPAAERIGAASDSFVPHRIERTDLGRAHPITGDVDDFDIVTEQYWVLHDGLDDVLATTTQAVRPGDPWRRPVTSPVVWTRTWGEGRVFVTTLGHDVATLETPPVRAIVENGLAWASR